MANAILLQSCLGQPQYSAEALCHIFTYLAFALATDCTSRLDLLMPVTAAWEHFTNSETCGSDQTMGAGNPPFKLAQIHLVCDEMSSAAFRWSTRVWFMHNKLLRLI